MPDRVGLVELGVKVQVCQGSLDDVELVVVVEDDIVGLERQMLCFAAQDAGAGGVECAQPDRSPQPVLPDRRFPARAGCDTLLSISRAALLVKVTARM